MTDEEEQNLKVGIICYPTYGGSGAIAVELAEGLAQRGHEVHVVSYASPFRLLTEANVFFHEVEVPEYPLFRYPPYAMALASRLAEEVKEHGIEVLHAHYAIPHSMAAFLACEMLEEQRPIVVTTLHGTDITLVGSDPSYRGATRFGIQKSDAVSAVSRFLANETAERIDASTEIEVIPNFVNTVRYAPRSDDALRERFAKPHEPLLMHMSNYRPVKRVADVVRIFHRVYRDHPVRLVMVGDGPERRMAERMVRELELHHRVTFTGTIPDAADLMAQMDAFLLPSDGESFGLAALEALACGVPVVGARAGGLPEVVADGEIGILEEVGKVEAMARRLSELLADPAEHARYGQRARALVEERYRTDRVVPMYEDFYRRTLAKVQERA